MRLYRLLKFAVLCIAVLISNGGCAPIGDVGGAGVGKAIDNLWIVPSRVAYNVNDVLKKNTDLKVFVSNRGIVENIPIDVVDIYIDEEPDSGEPDLYLVPPDENYPFMRKGRKLVIVHYKDMSAEYSVEIDDGYGLDNGNGNGNGSSGQDGPGIIIEWAD